MMPTGRVLFWGRSPLKSDQTRNNDTPAYVWDPAKGAAGFTSVRPPNIVIGGNSVQAPLPRQISSTRVFSTVLPEKDVDGFHPVNAGLLAIGDIGRALVPCTPAGSIILLRRAARLPSSRTASTISAGRLSAELVPV